MRSDGCPKAGAAFACTGPRQRMNTADRLRRARPNRCIFRNRQSAGISVRAMGGQALPPRFLKEKIGGATEAQPAVKPAIRPGRPNPGGVHAFRKVAFGRRTSPVSLCGSPFKNNICRFFRPETVWPRSTQRHPAPSSNSPEGKFPPSLF